MILRSRHRLLQNPYRIDKIKHITDQLKVRYFKPLVCKEKAPEADFRGLVIRCGYYKCKSDKKSYYSFSGLKWAIVFIVPSAVTIA